MIAIEADFNHLSGKEQLSGPCTGRRPPQPPQRRVDQGEFDNNFDGVVTAIFHIVDAYELAASGIKRRVNEAEQATRIESSGHPRAARRRQTCPRHRLIDLNRRRNTSAHGEWMEVIDQEALSDAIRAATDFLAAVRRGLVLRISAIRARATAAGPGPRSCR